MLSLLKIKLKNFIWIFVRYPGPAFVICGAAAILLFGFQNCALKKNPNTTGFDGVWEMASGEQTLLIEKDNGAICASDSKSSAQFNLSGNIMGSYGYGTGDTLSINKDGNILTRTTLEKGETFIVTYNKVNEIPTYCLEQGISFDSLTGSVVNFDGVWEMASGEQALLIQKDNGAICASDSKSSARFNLSGNVMGSYGYGIGDTLSINKDGNILTRTTLEKGETFIVTYNKVDQIPTYCIDQNLTFETIGAGP